MTEREKIIEGLERRQRFKTPDGSSCVIPANLLQDALALLKAQQPRVMTLDEVKASKGADMYLEISTRTDEIPYITAATLDGVGTKGVAFYCSHFDFVAYNRRLYGWRCWTSARPTDAQREATPWSN